MTTHWVSNLADGNDANPGTEASPKANPHAVTMADGDTMNIKGGGAAYNRAGSTYTLDVIARAGITIQRWPGFAKPVFTHTGGGGFGRALGVGGGGSATVTISGIIFDTTDEGGLGSAGSATANVVVSDCEFYDCGLANDVLVTGSSIVIGTGTSIASLRVLDTIVENSGRANIFANVTGTYEVGRCTISGAGLANPGGNTGDNVECGVTPYLYWVHNNTITHTKNAKQFVQQSGGSLVGTAIIEDNTFVGPSSGTSFKGMYLEMRAIVRRNTMTTAGIAMNLQGGGTVHSNTVTINGSGWGSGVGTLYFINNLATTQYIHNNTIIFSSGANQDVAISAFTASTGTYDIQNNLIVGAWPVGIKRLVASTVENYNCIFGATEEVTDESNAPLSIGANSITTDPLLSGYKPLVGSPCIGTGTAVGGFLDAASKPFRVPAMIGALESRAGQTLTSSSGTVVPSESISAVGSALTGATGSVSPNNDGIVPLTGSQVSSAQQTISPSWSQALAGSASSSAAGTISINLRPTNMVGQLITSGSGVVSAAGDGVTVNITGIDVTASAGIITGGTQALSGLALTTSAGTVLLDLTVPVVGLGIASGIGNVAAEQDAVDTYIASGIGIVALQFSVDLVGEALTSAQGVVSITGDVDVALTGASSTATAGSILIEEAYPITGSSMTASQYNLGAPGGATLTGAEILTVAGEIFTTGDRTYALIGQGMTAQDGITFASSLAFVTGQELTIGMEGIGPREAVLTGISINLSQGRLTALLPEVIGGGGYDYTYLLRKKKKKKEEKPEPITTAKEIVEILEKPRKPKETDAERRKKEEELLLLG